MALTLFVAAFCIVVGVFRVVAALAVHYPYWGLVVAERMITFLLGVIIYHHFPRARFGFSDCWWAWKCCSTGDVDHAVAGDQEDSRAGGGDGCV